jgi:hypothetical protein
MRQSLRLFVAAVGLISCALPVFAEEDDLLRPMIVRPTDAAPTTVPKEFAPDRPSSRAPLVQNDPVESSSVVPAPSPKSAVKSTGGKLRVPKLSQASSLANSPTAAAVKSNGALFANFGSNTGSAISDQVFKLREQTVAFRQKVDQNTAAFNELRGKGAAGAIQYHATVAAITARLETGTTRGNPILLRQWSEAEQALSEVSYSLSRLNTLSTELSGTAATASTLARQVKEARDLPGAVDEDHVQLAMIRDEVAKGTIQLDNMRGDVGKDIQRQTSYLATEKRTLERLSQSIERGEMIRSHVADSSPQAAPEVGAPETNQGMPTTSGKSPSALPRKMESTDMAGVSQAQDNVGSPPPAPILPDPAVAEAQPPLEPQQPLTPPPSSMQQQQVASGPGQLLVLVRFNQEVVNYEQPLYQAVSDALDRKPDAAFTVVAVAPKSHDKAAQQGDTQSAQRHAEAVKASLTQLGLQGSRVTSNSISSEAAMVPEVHVYVR